MIKVALLPVFQALAPRLVHARRSGAGSRRNHRALRHGDEGTVMRHEALARRRYHCGRRPVGGSALLAIHRSVDLL